MLDLADACVLVAERGRLMQAAREDGTMAAIQATEAEVRESLTDFGDAVVVAGVNGPRSTVISGDELLVNKVVARWREVGAKTKLLPVSHAFHSPHMDAVLEEFRSVAEGLTFRSPTIPVVSNVTGTTATADQLTSPDYWARHIREAVRFADGVRHLEELGVTDWLELGPDGVLTALVEECLTDDAGSLAPALRERTGPSPTASARRWAALRYGASRPTGRRSSGVPDASTTCPPTPSSTAVTGSTPRRPPPTRPVWA